MKAHLPPISHSRQAFALISVLALVSLAALTATAFLASARLERSATRPIGDVTRLQMTLNTGKECATEVINRVGEPYWNFVTTYWRTNPADDFGYLFLGKMSSTNSLAWRYTCGFTPSTWTNLNSNSIDTNVTATNLICQASFSNDISNFMLTNTVGFTANPSPASRICTLIPMLGGRTSPPVGWVYIKQDIRTNPASTNTTNLPVSRFAYFIEDLGGLIDAERMGGTNSRPTGTNAEEISLTNLTGVTAPTPSTYTNNRPKYLTPGMLLSSNGGFLANTNNLRYFASRLRYCNWSNQNSNWSRIPFFPISSNAPYYPRNAGYRKYPLTDLTLGGQSEIAATIISNFPNFSTRAGGMNTNVYVNALAANIVDYADADSSATIKNIGGLNVVGYDSYPLVTQLFDQFVCNQTGNNPPIITVNTYLQFWNPSSSSSPATTYTLLYDFADTVHTVVFTNATSTNSNVVTTRMFPTNGTYTNSVGTVRSYSFSNNIPLPLLSANQGTIVSLARSYTISSSPPTNFVWSNFSSVWINGISGSTPTNPFTIRIGTNDLIQPKNSFFRSAIKLTNNETNWLGTIPGLRFGAGPIPAAIGWASQSRLPADPRMLNFLTSNPTTNGSAVSYSNTFWRGYPAETTGANLWGHPSIWPDGYKANISTRGITNPPAPSTGTFTIQDPLTLIADPAPCKISNFGSYTNICELGNIFDPIQWAPPVVPAITNYAIVDIRSTWAANSIYGGGSSLRIGRPEHSRFAFTNLTSLPNSYPVPALGTSAAGLLDLFCVTNTYDWAGKININTAPLPVLAALAGGISVTNTSFTGSAPTNQMIYAFTNGVARFRSTYPFITPSQLAFISSDYGTNTTFTNSWPTNAVFSTNASGGLQGPTAINDQGREEWFSKIYNLTCVSKF